MKLSDRVPIHGGHPMCECGNCHETLLISWSFWRGLQSTYGEGIYIVLPTHAHEGNKLWVETSLYAVVKAPDVAVAV